MNRAVLIASIASLAGVLHAADITLTDGRFFNDYRIVGEDATTVTILYKKGGAKVEKRVLPPAILAEHPIDKEAVAVAEAEKKAIEQQKAEDERQAAMEKKEREEAARAEQRKEDIEFQKEQMARLVPAYSPGEVKDAVRKRAEEYFNVDRVQPNASFTIELKLNLDEPREVQGWPGRYEVVGVGWWQSVESSSSFNSGKSWFRAEVWPDKSGHPIVRDFSPLISEPIR